MNKYQNKRLVTLILAVCIGIFPFVPNQVQAAGYYGEDDLGNIRCTILSDSTRADYVTEMMKYHILSATGNYRIAKNLEQGKSAVFFFDGCSDNVDDPTYGNYDNYHLSAYCAVVKKVDGVLTVVFESEDCTTIPDNPRNVELNEGTAVPTVLDGVYNIITTNHGGRYAALNFADGSGTTPVIRCTSSESYISTSSGINLHARRNFPGAPTDGICSDSYSTTGCFVVGRTNDGWREYNDLIFNVMGIENAIITTPDPDGTWTQCEEYIDKGIVIVDRSQYKEQLAAIYGDDNSHSADELVAKITAYTDRLGNSDSKAMHRYEINGVETTAYYATVEEALENAVNGTVTLVTDAAEGTLVLKPGVILDLAGHALTASYLIVTDGAAIFDGGADCTGGGLLKIAKDNLIYVQDNGNGIIPVWNGVDGYLFTQVTFQQMVKSAGEDTAQYIFLPTFSNGEASALLADGGLDNGLKIKVSLIWNDGYSQQLYTYRDELVAKVFDGTNSLAFDLKITGIAGITDMVASPVVITDCNSQATIYGIAVGGQGEGSLS